MNTTNRSAETVGQPDHVKPQHRIYPKSILENASFGFFLPKKCIFYHFCCTRSFLYIVPDNLAPPTKKKWQKCSKPRALVGSLSTTRQRQPHKTKSPENRKPPKCVFCENYCCGFSQNNLCTALEYMKHKMVLNKPLWRIWKG